MKNWKLFFILFILFVSTASAQTQPFRFALNFNEFTNLTYQLDCLSNLTYCTTPDYQALWQKEFLKDEADKKMLESWRSIRNRYQKYFEIDNDLKFPISRGSSGVNLMTKIQIAGLQAKNLEEYQTRLDLLVVPFEREEFVKVIKHFQPKFSAWWEKEAKPKGANFANKTEELLNNDGVKSNITKFYAFYQPSLPAEYLITFNLFYRPQVVKAGSGGQATENQLMVEFFSDENPKRRMDVVLHEFCHFMMNSISPTDQIALQNKFVKSGRVTAIPAFGLMDEALASVLGNGIITRLFTTPESFQKYLAFDLSFYNNPNIDKAGKALLPVMDDWLAKGGKLNDENFVNLYLDTLEKTFGEKLTSPRLFLAQSFLFLDGKFDAQMRRPIRQTLNISSLYSQTGDLGKIDLEEYFGQPNLSSVFIVNPINLKQLATRKVVTDKDLKEIEKIYKTEKRALYSVKRNENAFTFIVVAENDESAKKVIEDLASAPKSFVGKFTK